MASSISSFEKLEIGRDNETTGSESPKAYADSLMAEPNKLAIDHEEEDEDVDLPSSETASISSSLYEHVQENGRTYHKYKEGKYILPNDELEQNRLDFQHYLCKLTLHGRLHLAPLRKSHLKHVLDFGTGTGIWAIDFAQQYPNANVIGSDLSPIQPEFVPPNLSFEVDDIDDEWIYPSPFSYIHARLMVLCFTDTLSVFQKAFDALEPGGYFEMQDTSAPLCSIDGSIKGTAMEKCWEMMKVAGLKRGIDIEGPRKYKGYMEKVGFVDVREVALEWPIGAWAKSPHHKRIGAWLAKDLSIGFKGMIMGLFTRVLGMTKEEVDKIGDEAIREMNDRRIHSYQPFYVVYGRKPKAGEVVGKMEAANEKVDLGDEEKTAEEGEPSSSTPENHHTSIPPLAADPSAVPLCADTAHYLISLRMSLQKLLLFGDYHPSLHNTPAHPTSNREQETVEGERKTDTPEISRILGLVEGINGKDGGIGVETLRKSKVCKGFKMFLREVDWAALGVEGEGIKGRVEALVTGWEEVLGGDEGAPLTPVGTNEH